MKKNSLLLINDENITYKFKLFKLKEGSNYRSVKEKHLITILETNKIIFDKLEDGFYKIEVVYVLNDKEYHFCMNKYDIKVYDIWDRVSFSIVEINLKWSIEILNNFKDILSGTTYDLTDTLKHKFTLIEEYDSNNYIKKVIYANKGEKNEKINFTISPDYSGLYKIMYEIKINDNWINVGFSNSIIFDWPKINFNIKFQSKILSENNTYPLTEINDSIKSEIIFYKKIYEFTQNDDTIYDINPFLWYKKNKNFEINNFDIKISNIQDLNINDYKCIISSLNNDIYNFSIYIDRSTNNKEESYLLLINGEKIIMDDSVLNKFFKNDIEYILYKIRYIDNKTNIDIYFKDKSNDYESLIKQNKINTKISLYNLKKLGKTMNDVEFLKSKTEIFYYYSLGLIEGSSITYNEIDYGNYNLIFSKDSFFDGEYKKIIKNIQIDNDNKNYTHTIQPINNSWNDVYTTIISEKSDLTWTNNTNVPFYNITHNLFRKEEGSYIKTNSRVNKNEDLNQYYIDNLFENEIYKLELFYSFNSDKYFIGSTDDLTIIDKRLKYYINTQYDQYSDDTWKKVDFDMDNITIKTKYSFEKINNNIYATNINEISITETMTIKNSIIKLKEQNIFVGDHYDFIAIQPDKIIYGKQDTSSTESPLSGDIWLFKEYNMIVNKKLTKNGEEEIFWRLDKNIIYDIEMNKNNWKSKNLNYKYDLIVTEENQNITNNIDTLKINPFYNIEIKIFYIFNLENKTIPNDITNNNFTVQLIYEDTIYTANRNSTTSDIWTFKDVRLNKNNYKLKITYKNFIDGDSIIEKNIMFGSFYDKLEKKTIQLWNNENYQYKLKIKYPNWPLENLSIVNTKISWKYMTLSDYSTVNSVSYEIYAIDNNNNIFLDNANNQYYTEVYNKENNKYEINFKNIDKYTKFKIKAIYSVSYFTSVNINDDVGFHPAIVDLDCNCTISIQVLTKYWGSNKLQTNSEKNVALKIYNLGSYKWWITEEGFNEFNILNDATTSDFDVWKNYGIDEIANQFKNSNIENKETIINGYKFIKKYKL